MYSCLVLWHLYAPKDSIFAYIGITIHTQNVDPAGNVVQVTYPLGLADPRTAVMVRQCPPRSDHTLHSIRLVFLVP